MAINIQQISQETVGLQALLGLLAVVSLCQIVVVSDYVSHSHFDRITRLFSMVLAKGCITSSSILCQNFQVQ